MPAASVRPRFDELLPPAFWPRRAPFLIDCLAEAEFEAAVAAEAAVVAAEAAAAVEVVEDGEHNLDGLQLMVDQLGPQEN